MSLGIRLEHRLEQRSYPFQIELAGIEELDYKELEQLLREKEGTGSKFPMFALRKNVENPPKADVWSHNGEIGEAIERIIEYSESKASNEKDTQAFGSYAENLKRRSNNLKKIAAFIVKEQEVFFKGGAIKECTQRECAEAVGIHESHVSRAIKNNKTIEVDGRVETLSRFFTDTAIHPETINAWLISQEEIKKADRTNKSLSDRELTEKWNEENKDFADKQLSRRTMAKYREMAGISPSEYKRSASEITALKLWIKEQIGNEDTNNPLTDNELRQRWNIDNFNQQIDAQLIAKYRNELSIPSFLHRKKKIKN